MKLTKQKIGHECSLVGIVLAAPNKKIHNLVGSGLDALNHRGEEAAGIAWINKKKIIKIKKGLGLRQSALSDDFLLDLSAAATEIGHTRYSTAGQPNAKNVQPFVFNDGQFAIAHNGNVCWDKKPDINEPTSDTYGIGKEIANGKGKITKKIIKVLSKLNGAYVFLFVTPNGLYAARDPWGFRPLVGGRLDNGIKGYVVGSESIGLHDMHAIDLIEIPRGSLIQVCPKGYKVIWTDPRANHVPQSVCSFEQSYFADAASIDLSIKAKQTNHELRVLLGRQLFKKNKPKGDLVTSVPSSGRSYAEGVALESGIPIMDVIHINRHAGRGFIKPGSPSERKESVFKKYRFIQGLINNKKLIVVDDSIVRGSTSSGFILNLFDHGAKHVELLLGVPPITHPCFWGIDFHNPMDLIYNQLMSQKGKSSFEKRLAKWLVGGNKELSKKIHVHFQTLDDYVSIIRQVPGRTSIKKSGGCFHCVSGRVPFGAVTDSKMTKNRFEEI